MDDASGKIAAGLVVADDFEPPYDDIAGRAIAYHARYNRAPGSAHLDDLFDHILSDKKSKKQKLYQNVLGSILEQAKGLNAPYVLTKTSTFLREQQLKSAVLKAAERYQRSDEELVPDVENILHGALKFKDNNLDAGTFLNDRKRALRFLDAPAQQWALGISEFDRLGICPTAGRLFVFMAPKGRGKSWFCVDANVKALMQGAKVAHITLEMDEEEVTQRYFQRLFAIAKRDDKFTETRFDFDELNRVRSFMQKDGYARLNLRDPNIHSKILTRMDDWGTRFGRLVVKRFPVRRLNMKKLEAWLDALELTYGFVPNVLTIDYPKLMDLDRRQDLRIGLGMVFEDIKGLCQERNMAGIAPHQGNRESEDTRLITGKNIGEDYSIGQTGDFLVTYNQTKAEHALGLARLYVDKARSDRDKITVLITQNYATGQFCMQSAYMPGDFWAILKKHTGQEEGEPDEE